MTWVKIDDSFPDHPKIIGLSDSAFRAHIQGLCYCGRFLTDGFIPSAAIGKIGALEAIGQLIDAGLWQEEPSASGYLIYGYLDHQTSKKQVEEKRETVRQRQKRYRDKTKDNGEGNALVSSSEDRIQSTEYINTEDRIQKTEEELPAVRNKSAKESVERISNKLADARANGINAWNLSKLVEEEWDTLHNANDIGGCIALPAWYVSELQTRALSSAEIGRIGQMTKRFGRIALLAIDEAASKDLTDLVSYAYRVAQNMYSERKANEGR
jgi:CHASE3 domain sensor protein